MKITLEQLLGKTLTAADKAEILAHFEHFSDGDEAEFDGIHYEGDFDLEQADKNAAEIFGVVKKDDKYYSFAYWDEETAEDSNEYQFAMEDEFTEVKPVVAKRAVMEEFTYTRWDEVK
ncbi:hypothetical protein EQG49_08395 [Periweissella cryptocerci]|uniref:Uncharacterized protein n=1 Tax=Periweissella cryptocerci TaxID=2506420 RepID=A0A4P6YUM1_9LACO|nr:hypothetical protein [Periweissella cryptocerci]QBO36489.1 hypothetical protein EQG49_08395 [Periweissella cryptocerci]